MDIGGGVGGQPHYGGLHDGRLDQRSAVPARVGGYQIGVGGSAGHQHIDRDTAPVEFLGDTGHECLVPGFG